MPRPQPQTYNSDYGAEFRIDPRHLNLRPPPRAMSNSPVMVYREPQPNHFAYRNPAAMRSAPGLTMPPQALGPFGPPNPHLHPMTPPFQYQMMQRTPYGGPVYAQRPGHSPYPPMQHPMHRGPPPPHHVAPMAHHMFHNAARMARQLPQRTDTPMTDGGAPSSDPPSSGTAPTVSGPSTPRDQTTLQVAVDPAFIDPAFMDLPDSSSEPVLAHQYLRYAEGLEKDIDDSEIEAVHPSVPPSGFVQRVRAMLESKAAAEAAAMKDNDRAKTSQQALIQHEAVEQVVVSEEEELHELAAHQSPRFTIIEEYNAPVELPASPVRIAELAGSPIQPKRRITREMIKAHLASYSIDTSADVDAIETRSIEVVIQHKPTGSQVTEKDTTDTERVCEPSTPAGEDSKKEPDADSEPTTESSPASLGPSAVNYAIGFDSTTGETHSKDPFALDADTITLQHQKSRETVNRTESPQNVADQERCNTQVETEMPVSPILAGEDVSRCSAVSPLHTQTLGIDETLRMAPEGTQERSSAEEEHTVPGAFPEENPPPPTPRTSKTYSKSVQIQPTSTATSTPSSNRFSLPPDLSTVGETTMNSNSDMITDVAVRFSLPQTTITVSRPQIIEIPPSSSPEREPVQLLSIKPALHASDSKSKRGSVTFADEVAPLKINKKLEQHPTNIKNNELRHSKGKSIVRRPSPLQESGESSQISRDSTTDLRFSGINAINNRFGSTHLPGLKEESVEEMSISDKRATDMSGSFQFPLPSRIAAVKAMQERRMQESAEKAKARRAARHPNRQLAEIRDLPSLNFSRMDLIDKLNEALEVRSSRSMDVIRRREFSGIYCPSPQRPQSTEPLRDRYMSFFSKPEDFSSFFHDLPDTEDEDEMDTEAVVDPGLPTVEVQPNTEIELSEEKEASSRALSPEDFLSVANQVNRLSIPSVSGLSERLSEILPNLRELRLDHILANFGELSEDVRLLGDGTRPNTVFSTRTSAGFRTLAERAEEIVNNGTHDSTIPFGRLLGGNKELPALPESMSADMVTAMNTVDGKQAYLSGSVSAPTNLGKDVTRPSSAFTRTMSPLTEDEVRTLLPPEMNPIARNSQRALITSTASSRPWNQDENYPWASTKVEFDLTVPSQAYIRDSTASQTLLGRKTKSLDLSSSGEPTNVTEGIDIGSIMEHDPTPEVTQEQLTGFVSPPPLRKQSKRSVIGSITRRIGLSRSDCNTTRSIGSPIVQSDGDRTRSVQAHRAGERYPTSGLTPPAAFNLDEVRSFFSDNSSEKERNASFRKRLTNFKGKGKSVRLDTPARHSMDGNTAYDAGEMVAERIGANSSANTYDGVGMGKAEFRIKRFGEKLRHLMAKGGDLIRSWSQRSKAPRNERVRDDWLSDSLYSGV